MSCETSPNLTFSDPSFLKLPKLTGKRIRHEFHCTALRVHLGAGVPPKWLRLLHRPSMNDLNSHERTVRLSVLNNASLELVRLTINDCDKKATELRDEEDNFLKSDSLTSSDLKSREEFETKLRNELLSFSP